MAEPSRFAQLAPSFAIVGAAAGWLSAGLVANPLIQGAERVQGRAALFAAGAGALTGALLTRWCVRKRYRYQLDEEGPERPAPSDTWWRHIVTVLVAGTATGAAVAAVFDAYISPKYGALGGLLCSLAFVPVCAAVILAARRARRARLGSIVAGCDRRAVWGVLATSLAIATLEAAIDWPAAARMDAPAPWPAAGILAASGLVIAAVLGADVRARRRGREAIGAGLVEHDPTDIGAEDAAVPRVDFGFGDSVAAQITRSAGAYRGRGRTVALVQGNPEQALTAIKHAIRRDVIGLAMVCAASCLHGAACSGIAGRIYDDERCTRDDFAACGRAADALRERTPDYAAALYERACHGMQASSCAALARMYEGGEGIDADPKRTAFFHERACAGGVAASCRPAATLPDPCD